MPYVFQREATGEVTVVDAGSRRVVWSGLPGARRAHAVLPLTSDHCVVLAEQDLGVKNDRNLYCLDSRGGLVWTAETPDPSGPDSYLGVEFSEGEIVARSWSCYRVVIDSATGAIREKAFTK